MLDIIVLNTTFSPLASTYWEPSLYRELLILTQVRVLLFAESMLNTSPDDRYGIDHVLKSDWLIEASAYQSRFNNNSVYGHWCAYPTTTTTGSEGNNGVEVTDTEANARQALEVLGISRAMLDEHGPLGSRSNVVATYRIVVNRLLQQRRLMGQQQQHQNSVGPQSQQAASSRKHFKIKSRLCAITWPRLYTTRAIHTRINTPTHPRRSLISRIHSVRIVYVCTRVECVRSLRQYIYIVYIYPSIAI